MDLRLYIVVFLIVSSQMETRKKNQFKGGKKATLALGLCIQEASRNTHSATLGLSRTAHSLAKTRATLPIKNTVCPCEVELFT